MKVLSNMLGDDTKIKADCIAIKDGNNNVHTIDDYIGDIADLNTSDTSSVIDSINSLTPTILYSNSTGSTSSITLNNSYTNYKYIEMWGNRNGRYGYAKLDTSVSNSISLIVANPSTSNITFYNALCIFSNKTLSLSGNAIALSSSAIVGYGTSNEVAIVKVIGYK